MNVWYEPSDVLEMFLFISVCVCVCADYFAKHMGEYEGVLASLETLNLSILKAMDFTKKVIWAVCLVAASMTSKLQEIHILNQKYQI